MSILLALFGLSAGIIVGAGVIAIFVLVGVVPRMAYISKTINYIKLYESILVVGAFLGGIISIFSISLHIPHVGLFLKIQTVVIGLSYGVFIGFLSSGLTEIMDYIPVVSRRLKLSAEYFKYLIIALLIGKVIGSLLGWLII